MSRVPYLREFGAIQPLPFPFLNKRKNSFGANSFGKRIPLWTTNGNSMKMFHLLDIYQCRKAISV